MKKYLRFSIYSGVSIILIISWTRMVQETGVGERILLKTAQISATETNSKVEVVMTEVEIQHYLRKARRQNEERQLRVAQICEKYNLGLYRNSNASSSNKHPKVPRYDIFFVDMVNKISWCPIEYAAFESWLFYFGLMAGHSEKELNSTPDLKNFLRQRYPHKEPYEIEEALQSTLKFIVVKHPFERILSIYKGSWKSFRRKKYNKTEEEGQFKKTEVNVRTTSNLIEIKPIDEKPQSKHSEEAQEESRPSFQEFVSYILDNDFDPTTEDNVSWIPYHLLCTPCLLKYQIIAKVETMKEDEIYIIRAAGLQNIIKSRGEPELLPKTYSSHLSEEAKKYFSQISKLNVHKLFEKYKLDFELFNYNFKEYVNCAH